MQNDINNQTNVPRDVLSGDQERDVQSERSARESGKGSNIPLQNDKISTSDIQVAEKELAQGGFDWASGEDLQQGDVPEYSPNFHPSEYQTRQPSSILTSEQMKMDDLIDEQYHLTAIMKKANPAYTEYVQRYFSPLQKLKKIESQRGKGFTQPETKYTIYKLESKGDSLSSYLTASNLATMVKSGEMTNEEATSAQKKVLSVAGFNIPEPLLPTVSVGKGAIDTAFRDLQSPTVKYKTPPLRNRLLMIKMSDEWKHLMMEAGLLLAFAPHTTITTLEHYEFVTPVPDIMAKYTDWVLPSYTPKYKSQRADRYTISTWATALTPNSKSRLFIEEAKDHESHVELFQNAVTQAFNCYYGNGNPLGQAGRLKQVYTVHHSSRESRVAWIDTLDQTNYNAMMELHMPLVPTGALKLNTDRISSLAAIVDIAVSTEADPGVAYNGVTLQDKNVKKGQTIMLDLMYADTLMALMASLSKKDNPDAAIRLQALSRLVKIKPKEEVYTVDEYKTKTRNIFVYNNCATLPLQVASTDAYTVLKKTASLTNEQASIVGISQFNGTMSQFDVIFEEMAKGENSRIKLGFSKVYADNLYMVLRVKVGEEIKEAIVSMDGSKMEACIRYRMIRMEMVRLYQAYSKVSKVTDAWKYYLLEVVPYMTVNSIGLLGSGQYITNCMGSGMSMTALFNTACMIVASKQLGEMVNNSPDSYDMVFSPVDGKYHWGPWLTDRVLDIGVVLSIESVFFNERPFVESYAYKWVPTVKTDFLGFDCQKTAATFSTDTGEVGLVLSIPVLSISRWMKSLLFPKKTQALLRYHAKMAQQRRKGEGEVTRNWVTEAASYIYRILRYQAMYMLAGIDVILVSVCYELIYKTIKQIKKCYKGWISEKPETDPEKGMTMNSWLELIIPKIDVRDAIEEDLLAIVSVETVQKWLNGLFNPKILSTLELAINLDEVQYASTYFQALLTIHPHLSTHWYFINMWISATKAKKMKLQLKNALPVLWSAELTTVMQEKMLSENKYGNLPKPTTELVAFQGGEREQIWEEPEQAQAKFLMRNYSKEDPSEEYKDFIKFLSLFKGKLVVQPGVPVSWRVAPIARDNAKSIYSMKKMNLARDVARTFAVNKYQVSVDFDNHKLWDKFIIIAFSTDLLSLPPGVEHVENLLDYKTFQNSKIYCPRVFFELKTWMYTEMGNILSPVVDMAWYEPLDLDEDELFKWMLGFYTWEDATPMALIPDQKNIKDVYKRDPSVPLFRIIADMVHASELQLPEYIRQEKLVPKPQTGYFMPLVIFENNPEIALNVEKKGRKKTVSSPANGDIHPSIAKLINQEINVQNQSRLKSKNKKKKIKATDLKEASKEANPWMKRFRGPRPTLSSIDKVLDMSYSEKTAFNYWPLFDPAMDASDLLEYKAVVDRIVALADKRIYPFRLIWDEIKSAPRLNELGEDLRSIADRKLEEYLATEKEVVESMNKAIADTKSGNISKKERGKMNRYVKNKKPVQEVPPPPEE